MDYILLDEKIMERFDLAEGSVFISEANKFGDLLEFVYPDYMKGNLIPVNIKSRAGRSVITKSPVISNSIQKSGEFSFLDCLTTKNGTFPIQKMITYPILLSDKVVSIINIVRRGNFPGDSPDFDSRDLATLKLLLGRVPTAQTSV